MLGAAGVPEYDERQLQKDLIFTADLHRGVQVVIGFTADGRPTRLVTVKHIFEMSENSFAIEWLEGGRSYVHGDVKWRLATTSILRRASTAAACSEAAPASDERKSA